jgi:hypothetical protein
MRTIKHPLSGATYDRMDDGTVRVVTRDGRSGRFDQHGTWLSGDARQADPHLCLWIGGKELPNRSRRVADAVTSDGAAGPATTSSEVMP